MQIVFDLCTQMCVNTAIWHVKCNVCVYIAFEFICMKYINVITR